MGKKLTAFLIIFFVILAAGGVIGVDIYMSYQDVQENIDQFTVGAPTFDISSDNTTITVTATVGTPKLGYIPKSIRLDIQLKKGGTEYGDIQQITIKLGESAPVEFVFVLTTDDVNNIGSGGTITITIEISAIPVYFGIPLTFLTQDLPPQDILIP
ncbi:MAG: hypothetical protein KGD64_06445 [Candidatus Heimdallarchaeota archaeon]|nr:hypothetical protein [Candidatus Heimdallarchaeota archaeon]